MNYTAKDIDAIEQWWIKKSRVNFLAYRQFMRCNDLICNWFIADLCSQLQQFYIDLKAGFKPILLIQSPPQHGKSWAIADFISWVSGLNPTLRTIYATFSDSLGVRCNLTQQRTIQSPKYKSIFSNIRLPDKKGIAVKTTSQLEFINNKGLVTGGYFRNTTTGGSVTGESADLGVIDDAVKGREQANSITWSEKIWNWYTDDFLTRFSENAGLLVIMTRWTTHDIIGRLIKEYKGAEQKIKVLNYQAIATKDEQHRKEGEALFPELKSLDFLHNRKEVMPQSSWESLYQGNPTISGGNKFKDEWWRWWKVLPHFDYKFITADTAQKTKTENDWTCFQCWGKNKGGIFLIDKFRGKLVAPALRREAEVFYRKHNTPRLNVGDPVLRGMYIEDKSSGTGLLQELRAKKLKVYEVPRNTDKIFRAEDASPYIEAGLVHLNTEISGVDNLTKEAKEFPAGEFDDDIDTCMTAIEVAFINKSAANMLAAAMEAD